MRLESDTRQPRIIETVLAETAPEHGRARELLRQQVAAHPGHPERALAEHLAALTTVAEPADGPSSPPSTTGRTAPQSLKTR